MTISNFILISIFVISYIIYLKSKIKELQSQIDKYKEIEDIFLQELKEKENKKRFEMICKSIEK